MFMLIINSSICSVGRGHRARGFGGGDIAGLGLQLLPVGRDFGVAAEQAELVEQRQNEEIWMSARVSLLPNSSGPSPSSPAI
ncbi:hypothetical protein [Hoeflea sp.]|uniref:hypothetical protein n=1 Tax=Hoeflea sp. TaxID=1940281 RepID=UPI003749CE2C